MRTIVIILASSFLSISSAAQPPEPAKLSAPVPDLVKGVNKELLKKAMAAR